MSRRPNDPQRRERIIEATLETIAEHGIQAVTHRKIASCADVPLGSITYYLTGIDALLAESFTRFTQPLSVQYPAFFYNVQNPVDAFVAVSGLSYSAQLTPPHNMKLMYSLYAIITNKPNL